MNEQSADQYERLLRLWHFSREMVNRYSRALQLLMLNDPSNRQQWSELSERLAEAEKALQKISMQMRPYEQAAAI